MEPRCIWSAVWVLGLKEPLGSRPFPALFSPLSWAQSPQLCRDRRTASPPCVRQGVGSSRNGDSVHPRHRSPAGAPASLGGAGIGSLVLTGAGGHDLALWRKTEGPESTCSLPSPTPQVPLCVAWRLSPCQPSALPSAVTTPLSWWPPNDSNDPDEARAAQMTPFWACPRQLCPAARTCAREEKCPGHAQPCSRTRRFLACLLLFTLGPPRTSGLGGQLDSRCLAWVALLARSADPACSF